MKRPYFVRTIILAGSLLLQLSTLCLNSRGAPGDVDLSFDPGSGVNGNVNAIAQQPDGKMIIAGAFTVVKGLARAGIARLNADGSGDATFDSSTGIEYAGYTAHSVVLQTDGKVLVGDNSGIKRLNPDGSIDASFDADIYSDAENYAPVNSIVLQPDGKVLIGGYFYTLLGTDWFYGIARLNFDGSVDKSFRAGTETVAQGAIYSVALQPDGKVILGGQWTTAGGLNKSVARLNSDGSVDNGFNAGSEISGVLSVAVQADGKVLISGSIASGIGTNKNIARLNANGNLDTTFNPGTGVNVDSTVSSVALQADGKVLLGGSFTTVNGTTRNRIARLNINGSLDNGFDPGAGANNAVTSLVVQSDGKLLIGGSFTAIDVANRNRIARLNADGSLDGSFHPGRGVDSSVSTLALQSDGKVLIGGPLTYSNGATQNGSARLNADGSLDGTFIPDNFHPDLGVVDNGYDYAVLTSAAVQLDSKVLVGGYIVHTEFDSEFGGYTYDLYFLYRLNADGSRDTTFNPGTISSNPVNSITVQADGKLLIGGYFSNPNGTNHNGIVRLHADGSLDYSFNPGVIAGDVSSVALRFDGRVLIGGAFTMVNGTYRNGIARLNANGSLDSSFNPGAGVNGVASVALQPDGKVLLGGSFTAVNGAERSRIARLNADGSLDTSFDPGTGANGIVLSLALQPDGNVIIGGDFTSVDGVIRPHVARLEGGGPVTFSLGAIAGNAEVTLVWNALPGATSYTLKRKSASTTLRAIASGITGTTFTDTSVTNGTEWFYVVHPVGANGEGGASNEASAVPNAPPIVSITSPFEGASYFAPALIAVTAQAFDADGSVTQVEFFEGDRPIGVDNSAPFETSWSGVPIGNYTITARATDNLGAVTTSVPVQISVITALPPAAPSSLVAKAFSRRQINLKWTDNAPDETGFKIERSTNGKPFIEIAWVEANVTTFASSGLDHRKIYSYRVRAYNAGGDSPYSNRRSATPKKPGTLLSFFTAD